MRLVGIGGSRSGAGKTTLACRLLPRLPGWAAIKLSRVEPGGGHGMMGDYEIRIAPTVLERPGSDTARLLSAGASAALWVVAKERAVPEALAQALAAIGRRPGVLLEGNAACAALPEAAVLFAVPAGEAGLKAGAAPLLARARVVVVTGREPQLAAGMSVWQAPGRRLHPLAVDVEDDPPWLAEVATSLREEAL